MPRSYLLQETSQLIQSGSRLGLTALNQNRQVIFLMIEELLAFSENPLASLLRIRFLQAWQRARHHTPDRIETS